MYNTERPETLETLFLLISDPVSITLQANRAEMERWRGLTQLYLLLSPPDVGPAPSEGVLARVALQSSPVFSATPIISSSPLNPHTW